MTSCASKIWALLFLGLCACGPMPTPDAEVQRPWRSLTEAGGGFAICPAGRRVRFTCSPTCGDGAQSCANTPAIRVCDASQSEQACVRGTSALNDGDAQCGGACSGPTVTCPASGGVFVYGYNQPAGGPFVCVAQGRDVGGIGM
ncbi:MAG: hypothetical protein Q8Q09_28010 [Deltaproteobacteria bacterium]|nr:hypothetical protein [Deltaproteobacteria bacterium]